MCMGVLFRCVEVGVVSGAWVCYLGAWVCRLGAGGGWWCSGCAADVCKTLRARQDRKEPTVVVSCSAARPREEMHYVCCCCYC